MCLICDINAKRIDINIARKIHDDIVINMIYDKLRGADCSGASIDDILSFFDKYDWEPEKLSDEAYKWIDKVKRKDDLKRSIQEEVSLD